MLFIQAENIPFESFVTFRKFDNILKQKISICDMDYILKLQCNIAYS